MIKKLIDNELERMFNSDRLDLEDAERLEVIAWEIRRSKE